MKNNDELLEIDLSKLPKVITDLRDFNLNTTDLLIIMISTGRNLSITELQKELDIAYKNIYPHLKKLEKFKIIKIKDNGPGKKKTIQINKKNERVSWLIWGISGFLGITDLMEEEIKKRSKN